MNYRIVHICVDDSIIETADPEKILEPVWWSGNIHDGPEEYDKSLSVFSHAQRLLYALTWYCSELLNGGHDQFYSNSTGMVWKEAMGAFEALELPEFASILRESAERLGGSPSLDHQARKGQLDACKPDFSDLDQHFYEADKRVNLDGRIMSFIRARPSDFYFEGKINKPII